MINSKTCTWKKMCLKSPHAPKGNGAQAQCAVERTDVRAIYRNTRCPDAALQRDRWKNSLEILLHTAVVSSVEPSELYLRQLV
jgi:hypothetical protein